MAIGDKREFVVTITANDQLAASVRLPDEQWRTVEIRLSDPTFRRRRHVRIDLRVNHARTGGGGVQVGAVTLGGIPR
jgi:hypothetical protein